jgi:hypothetical protein
VDESRFDSLVTVLGTSRRGTLKTLLGGAFGVLVASRGEVDVAAGCKKVGKKCNKSKDCCDGAKCKGGKKGKCRCKSGQSECDGEKACRDLNTDINHCGACGNACLPDEPCCDGDCSNLQEDPTNCGACGNACPEDENCCDGACTDIERDRTNCGTCGLRCPQGERCFNATCFGPGDPIP